MAQETEDDRSILTSFEPLSPERNKSGFSRFIEGWKKLTLNTIQDPVPRRDQSGTQFHSEGENFDTKQGLQREDSSRDDGGSWEALESNFGTFGKETKLGPSKTGVFSSDRHTRTPSSVLRRLSILISVERTTQQPSLSSSNLKQYWMPDKQCKVCYECGLTFHTFRRRHHCRLCGQIFCSKCCNEELSDHQIGYTGVLRVCVYCKKIVLAYTSSPDVDKNLKQLKQDLSLVSQPDCPATADGWSSSVDDPELNRSFDVLGVSAEEANLLKQDSFKELWQQITAPKTGLELQSHRIRLRTYSNCLVGRELVDWLVFHRKAPNRSQAFQVCQSLQDSGWIEALVNLREAVFKDDFVLYIPGPSASGDISFPPRPCTLPDFVHTPYGNAFDDIFSNKKYKECQRSDGDALLSSSYEKPSTGINKGNIAKTNSFSSIQQFVVQFQHKSLSCEDLFLKVDTMENEENKNATNESATTLIQSAVLDHFVYVDDCYLPKRLASKQADGTSEDDETGAKSNNKQLTKNELNVSIKESDESVVFDQLSSIHRRHISSFLAQLLDRVGLSQSWKEVIEPLALKVCEMVIPDVVDNDNMDIRQYVKIKKIPGGEKSDCHIVSGVVCTKNVVHKKMSKIITEPQILMLACPVDFQRVENKMASLDPLVLQEEEFLKNYVARIVALKPTIVLVEKSVTRLAQDMLLARGISVILNIKPKLMARISRCTEGDVLPSLDQGSRPNLGTCRTFKIEKYIFKNGTTKTLAFFEGCRPCLGSTIVIRGGNRAELSKVKHILRFMTFVAYNSKLEKAFIMDEFGTPFGNKNGRNEEKEGGDETNCGEDHSGRAFGKEGSSVEKEKECLDDEVQEGTEHNEAREEEETHDKDENVEVLVNELEVMKGGGREDKESAEGVKVINERSMVDNGHSNTDRSKETDVNREAFEKIMSEVILSSSPLISYPVPYILTSEGQSCQIFSYMDEDLYWSPLFHDDSPSETGSPEDDLLDDVKELGNQNTFMKETHPFIFAVLTKDAKEVEVQTLLAQFRAEGGRITLKRQHDGGYDHQKIEAVQNGVGDIHGRRWKTADIKESDDILLGNDFDSLPTEEFQYTLPLMRDCFDPFLHQMIAILFSSYSNESANFPHPCINPWTVAMEFYAKNDIALGCFLERYCFRSSYVCPNPNCDVPMVKHVRYFAHDNGAVYINMKNLEAPIPGFAKTLLTWSWCKQCKQVTPVVPVSPEAWRLSFAKYLELRIYGTCYRRRTTVSPCDHSLHQDHNQYFAFNNIVASFKYVPVKIYEVFLPPTAITLLEEERQPQFWIQHIQAMSVRVHQLVNSINERIATLKTESFISDCVTEIGHDQAQMHEKIKVLERKAMLLLHPPLGPDEHDDDDKLLEPHEFSTLEYEILDGLTILKRMMCGYGEKWNAQLSELVQLENEKKKSKSMDGKSSVYPSANNQSPTDDGSCSTYCVSQSESKLSSSTSDNNDIIKDIQISPLPPDNTTHSANHEVTTTIESKHSSSSESEAKVDMLNRVSSSASDKKFQKHSELWATLSREVNSTLKDSQLPEDRTGSKMKRTIRQFLPGVTIHPIPPPFPPHEHHMLPSSEMIPIVVNEKEPTSIIAYTLSTLDYEIKLQKIQDSMVDVESDKESFTCVDMDTDGVCRISTTTSSDAIPTRNRTRSEVETISSTSLLTSLDNFIDDYFECFESDDDESSSEKNTKNIDVEQSGDKNTENGTCDMKKDGGDTKDEYVTIDGKEEPLNFNSSAQEEEVEYHIRHSFSDSTAKFFCVVYFGEQFRRIRKTLFPGGEEKYIRSLQYCLEWGAKGGKSGSCFCKTKDDRFVIKEMSRSEAQSFLNIAPYYFEYIEESIKHQRPTLLAKILGVYRIGCTSKLTNAPIRKDLLVMDNLLYNCKADQVFDLKGSIRSRYIYLSSQENNVLLDENLLEMIATSPLFIRSQSKAVLSRAINRDTEFLARHMVMDYSLLLGIEQDSSKLVVGIIDFIRTFTWDKKLEMYVKSTGILGGQGKMPTVVSPELYRERFCEAMQRYFLMIPHKWLGLGNELK